MIEVYENSITIPLDSCRMSGLETALAAAGLKVLGDELIEWLRNRGDELSEGDWAEMGVYIARKLKIDYENFQSSFLHKSRKRKVVRRIESAAEMYRELSLIGEDREFDDEVVSMYSELADICSNWSIETDGLPGQYEERANEFFEAENEYRTLID